MPWCTKGLLKTAIRGEDPSFFLESLGGGEDGEVPDGEHLVPFGKASVRREGGDVTVVAIGRMVRPALAAADSLAEEGVRVEVVDSRTHLVIVDEARERCGAASQIAAVVAEKGFDALKAPVRRVATPNVAMPYAPNAEAHVLPDEDRSVAFFRDEDRLPPVVPGTVVSTGGGRSVNPDSGALLRGKVAVVTGGASGIGMGIAKQLIAEDMQVVIADVERAALERTAAEIGAVGIPTDVSDLDSVRALARAATERFGTVHVVCNNAGVGPMGRIADLKIEDWRWMIDVNLYGVIHGVQTFLPILEANPDGGHIVNTASMAGLVAPPRLGPYSVTKFGVVALTEVLAAELAQDGSKVGATVLCPGTVRTNIHTSSRNRPDQLAGGGLADVDISQDDNPAYRWISSEAAGAVVVRAVKRGDLYAFTHPDWYGMVEQRHQAIATAFRQTQADARNPR